MSNILNLVSLARKAGRLEAGEEPVGAAARSHQAKLILVAQDATDNTYRRVRHWGDSCNITWVSVPYSKAELGRAIGRGETAMVAMMDIGLAASVIKGLAQEDPEKYAIPLERLTTKNEKAQRRLQEKRQHEKNLKNGKYQAKQQAKAPEPQAPKEEKRSPKLEYAKPDGEQKKSQGSRPNRGKPYHAGGSGKKKYHAKGSGRSNRYEQFGPTGKPRPGHRKSRES